MQWGWSFSLDVALLAAGCNDPAAGASGSGIYNGVQGSSSYVQTNDPSSRMLIAQVPKLIGGDSTRKSASKHSTESENITSAKNSPVFEGDPLIKTTDSSAESNSSLAMLRDYIDVYETKLLIDLEYLDKMNSTFGNSSTVNVTLSTEITLCQNDFCCDFEVEMMDSFSTTQPATTVRGDDFSRLVYRLAVFDGVRSYGGGVATGGVQVCGIIPCLNLTLPSCGLRADENNASTQHFIGNLYKLGTTFKRISISANFFYNHTFVFPSVMVTGKDDEFGELLASEEVLFEKYEPFNHSLICSLSIEDTVDNLITAAVYARQFDKDGEPRTEASDANSPPKPYLILIFITLILQNSQKRVVW